MIPAAGYLHVSTGGGSAALLSSDLRKGRTGDYPSLAGTAEPSQLARSDFNQHLPTLDLFHHKCSLHPSATNVANVSFRFDQFVKLPPVQLFGCPHLMLASLPIVYLVVPTRHAAHLVNT